MEDRLKKTGGTKFKVKSVVGAKGAVTLNDRDRQAYIESVRVARELPANVVTQTEAMMLARMTTARHDVALCEEQIYTVADTFKDYWQLDAATLPISTVWRAVAVAFTVEDSENGEDARAAIPAVLDAVTLFEVDPMVGESYKVTTNGEGWVDLVKVAAGVAEDVVTLRAAWEETLDDRYQEQIFRGGIARANADVAHLRTSGMLPKLATEAWKVRLMDREEFEAFVRRERDRYHCLNPLCSNCLDRDLSWGELDDLIEDGKVAVVTRREESPLTRKMVDVIVVEAPSVGAAGMGLRDMVYGFETVKS
jgi:hypothetical protein